MDLLRFAALCIANSVGAPNRLFWALLQPVAADGTRLLHCLQTEAFPTPRGCRKPMADEQRRGTLCLLNVGLAMKL